MIDTQQDEPRTIYNLIGVIMLGAVFITLVNVVREVNRGVKDVVMCWIDKDGRLSRRVWWWRLL